MAEKTLSLKQVISSLSLLFSLLSFQRRKNTCKVYVYFVGLDELRTGDPKPKNQSGPKDKLPARERPPPVPGWGRGESKGASRGGSAGGRGRAPRVPKTILQDVISRFWNPPFRATLDSKVVSGPEPRGSAKGPGLLAEGVPSSKKGPPFVSIR